MNEADTRILAHSSGIRQVTIDLLKRVPEELLARKGKAEEWTIGRTFLHVAGGQSWWMKDRLRDGGDSIDDRRDGVERAAIVGALEQARKRMVSVFSSPREDRMGKTYSHGRSGEEHLGRDVVLYLTAHEVHHVGRIVAALRGLGFKDIPFMPRHQPAEGE